MKAVELVQQLAEQVQLPSLAPNADGIYEIAFDGNLDLEFEIVSVNQLIVRARLESLPDDQDDRAKMTREYLQRNLAHLSHQDQVVALDRLGGLFWIYRLVKTDSMDVRGFCAIVEEFLNSLEWWRQTSSTTSSTPTWAFPMLRP